jgi:hypothetical protein
MSSSPSSGKISLPREHTSLLALAQRAAKVPRSRLVGLKEAFSDRGIITVAEWLLPLYAEKASSMACTRYNHSRGIGCELESCSRRHSCIICGGLEHGAYFRKTSKDHEFECSKTRNIFNQAQLLLLVINGTSDIPRFSAVEAFLATLVQDGVRVVVDTKSPRRKKSPGLNGSIQGTTPVATPGVTAWEVLASASSASEESSAHSGQEQDDFEVLSQTMGSQESTPPNQPSPPANQNKQNSSLEAWLPVNTPVTPSVNSGSSSRRTTPFANPPTPVSNHSGLASTTYSEFSNVFPVQTPSRPACNQTQIPPFDMDSSFASYQRSPPVASPAPPPPQPAVGNRGAAPLVIIPLSHSAKVQFVWGPEDCIGASRKKRSFVFRARRQELDDSTAVKVKLIELPALDAHRDAHVLRLKAAVDIQCFLAQDSKYVANIWEFVPCAQVFHMRYAVLVQRPSGVDLRTYMRVNSDGLERNPELVRHICVQLVNALAHCHSNGVAHRDLGPGNVLISDAGNGRVRVKLCDFERATALHSTMYKPSMGGFNDTLDDESRCWSAPETLTRPSLPTDQPDFNADVWSLGCLVHFVNSCGAAPFEFVGQNQLASDIRELRVHLVGRFPAGRPLTNAQMLMESLALRMLVFDGRQRPCIQQVATHPALWSDAHFVEFIVAFVDSAGEATREILAGMYHAPTFTWEPIPELNDFIEDNARTGRATGAPFALLRHIRNFVAHFRPGPGEGRTGAIRHVVRGVVDMYPQLFIDLWKAREACGWNVESDDDDRESFRFTF